MTVPSSPAVRSSSPMRLASHVVGAVPGHANGGVVAGALVARMVRPWPAVAVRLERPIPLATTLRVDHHEERSELMHDGERLAIASVADHQQRDLLAEVADAAPRITAADASDTVPVVTAAQHPAPGCFVCGPAHPAGLHVRPGRIRERDVAATVWRPGTALATGGVVPAPYVWAALDCPAWFGAARLRPGLLGTIVGRQDRPLLPGEPVVVTGWRLGAKGRKTYAAAAVHRADGELIALATSTWIHPSTSKERR